MYDLEDARLQYEALKEVQKISPVLQVRAMLTQLGREWRDAGELLADNTDEAVDKETGEKTVSSRYGIEVAGALVGGMYVLDDHGESCRVIRTMSRDGQLSVHLTAPSNPGGQYINLSGPMSPVVVLK